jgi:glutamyl/glutaminyl-tRNA synthetase
VKTTTRFCPTANGRLHIGHACLAAVNERIARKDGGNFIIRFDDTSMTTRKYSEPELLDIVTKQKDDLEWLGIRTDLSIRQSQMKYELEEVFDSMVNILSEKIPAKIFERRDPEYYKMMYSPSNGMIPFPYDPKETFERVILDIDIQHVTHLCRGFEFSTEFSLYCFFCEVMGYEIPKIISVPRLVDFRGRDISKTNGGNTIHMLRERGWHPEDVRLTMRMSCLENTGGEWEPENFKKNPRLVIDL